MIITTKMTKGQLYVEFSSGRCGPQRWMLCDSKPRKWICIWLPRLSQSREHADYIVIALLHSINNIHIKIYIHSY